MATLQKIRNNAGLAVSIVIGLALLAFIMGDLLTSGSTLFNSSRTNVAEIGGKSVSIQTYQEKIDENIENYKRNTGQTSVEQTVMDQLQDQTWEQMVRDVVMEDELDELGIGICGDELFDIVQGNNIDPQIMQIPIFQNQQTGQFDRALVIQFLKNMELDPSGQAKASWTAFEKALAQEKINQKYNTLIEKAMISTTVQAKKEVENKGLKVDFDYVTIKYNTVSDSLISFTEKDLQKYYDENTEKFKQTEQREINYVTFQVLPSADDDRETLKMIENAKAEFIQTENNEQYISLNSDLPFDGTYYTKDELPASIANLFDSEAGTVYGPYKEDNAYKISKVVEFKSVPDSVKARHILIRAEAGIDAKAKADSLLNVIKKGGNFAELAKAYSQDGSAPTGGDLGWFKAGEMVKPFNDACFFGKVGDMVTVETQFGAHVLEVVDQSKKTEKVQIATLAQTVVASSKTYQNTYAQASKFGASNRDFNSFKTAAEKEGYTLKVASLKKEDKLVANLENSRSLVRWAYQSEKGTVSEILEFGDFFVIAALKSVQEEGIASLNEVKVDVEREIKKSKKAAYLIEKMAEASKNASSLQSVAGNLQTVVKEVVNANFAAYTVSGVGFEPELQAAVVTLPANKISEPIEGKNGVYVVQVKNVQNPTTVDPTSEKNLMARSYRSRVNYQVFEAVKEAAKIVDRRSEFY
ncbi:MAG: SurA N-terminal domain-containing protein [Salinivirgaceae bacterium]|nr:SurA N-terminal domain-containing protein [Salinivirgaceae bacterium]